MNELAVLKI
ncbi:Protein of unknown function [Bacillus cereus]|nr:Protein of unknown function [Bacillus cereus]